ncbi:MAG: UDP-N-acetylmuramoyl-tripeptide--D-alanyl-D-alanine ligase, partial [Cyclobacteriaceae bacterium]|nr:UDP-N-acetylmuramoyl-tripeptide--D-alanyl-D-alanine ligase [Cyclobacteriaceae bacterium]
ANHVGEIALLSAIAQPTHGFITNIGKAHIGTFGGFENIIRGKSELYQHLITQDGVVFINSLNPILATMAKRFKSPIFYPAKGDYYQCQMISADPFIKIETEDGTILTTQIIGSYNFENIATALCIGKYFGVELAKAYQAVVEYIPDNMRSQIIQKGTNTIILDAYNANPSSMQAAVESLASMNAENKVVIVGDMYELEDEAEKEHGNLGKLLQEKEFGRVYLCGTLIRAAKDKCPSARHFETRELLIDELKKNPITDSIILVKASRGIGLEGVVVFL